ncbi:hypothetical protein BA1DRAFT_03582 [Photorhabdus aegyptia]|uniref:Uncharacterized protein n=1 Tax=Photorhabdus aegyptia TaxID=2805098 RepID=A0A022PCJ9_9GAMM|nr:hypothetical protein BA1DRAFT_03582 [Photorhabdus aegyptia]
MKPYLYQKQAITKFKLQPLTGGIHLPLTETRFANYVNEEHTWRLKFDLCCKIEFSPLNR